MEQTLKTSINEWLSFCERNYTATTVRIYRCVIRQLLRYVSANGNGKQFTATSIESFLDFKYKDGGSKRQFNTYRDIIRSFCNWQCRKFGVTNPTTSIAKIKEGRQSPRVLSPNEYSFILKSVSGMDHDIISFLGNTGLRRDEFRRIKWKDIDQQLKFVRINGKGDKTRVVPLNNTAKHVLLKYKRLDDCESLQIAAKYYCSEGSSWLCRRISCKTGMKRFGSHAIRHFFATELIRKGVSIYKVSQILGHSSIKITEQIYIHLLPIDLYGVTDVLD